LYFTQTKLQKNGKSTNQRIIFAGAIAGGPAAPVLAGISMLTFFNKAAQCEATGSWW
jgi:hypothetical protein